jgi:hypothetical protein
MTTAGGDCLERLGAILVQSRTACYAWAVMPKHLRLMLRPGRSSILTRMRLIQAGEPALLALRFHQNEFRSFLQKIEILLPAFTQPSIPLSRKQWMLHSYASPSERLTRACRGYTVDTLFSKRFRRSKPIFVSATIPELHPSRCSSSGVSP